MASVGLHLVARRVTPPELLVVAVHDMGMKFCPHVPSYN
jgi:hypothetical protein